MNTKVQLALLDCLCNSPYYKRAETLAREVERITSEPVDVGSLRAQLSVWIEAGYVDIKANRPMLNREFSLIQEGMAFREEFKKQSSHGTAQSATV
ncbi:MAG: hypothetical protein V4474_04300 [Patescibacteria group bacterium]